jgi:cephalosporin-C deacetylase-like acetyl esterase
MTLSKRLLMAATVVVVVGVLVAAVLFWRNRVDDPADAQCEKPAITLGDRLDGGDHQEVEVHFLCEGASLAGTIYLPGSPGRHSAAVWVHGAGEAPRLGWGGQLLPGLVDADVVVLSYDKRGVGESEGECCPGDTGHFNLLTADAVGAVQVLRTLPEVDPARVGLVGASQAGWIVPGAAVDSDAAFVALSAAPTIAERTSNLYERLAAGEEGDLSPRRSRIGCGRRDPRASTPSPTCPQ